MTIPADAIDRGIEGLVEPGFALEGKVALDLRTDRPECLPIGFRALSKQSGTWKSITGDGTDRWWNWFTTIKGYNGGGGYWVVDELCWNTGGTHHTEIRTLSWEESRALEAEIARLKIEALPFTPSPAGSVTPNPSGAA